MPEKTPRLCVVGSANIDLTFRTSRLPRPGETLTGHAFHLGFGGKGANQAVMAARLGARVSLVAKLGRDAFAEQTRRHFQDEGLDITHVSVDERNSSGTAAIIVDDDARNCILVVPGANHGLTPGDVERAASVIESSAFVLCQLEVPVETTCAAFRIARAARVGTILNPAPAAPLPDELLGLTDLCVPNETEIELLTGQHVASLEEAASAAQVLRKRGVKTVIVTLGSRGALLVDGAVSLPVSACQVSAVDTSGAGDAFIGALAVFLAEGVPWAEAVQRANAAAALSVTRSGTQSSFPKRAEVEAFLHTFFLGGKSTHPSD
jgi:ribokinase